MKNSSIVTPKVAEGFVSRQTNLGIDSYDLDELYSPDTDQWRSKVLHLGSPKYPPQAAAAPTRYWFDRSRFNNHGTITGATWKQLPSGVWVMNFAGGDDFTRNTTANWRSADSQGTILLWFRDSTAGVTAQLFSSDDEGGAANYVFFRINGTNNLQVGQNNNDGAGFIAGAANVVDGVWHLGAVTSSGTAYAIYLDGAADGAGGGNGDWFADTTLRDNFAIGVKYDSVPDSYFTGDIGEVLVYSRELTSSEIQRIYLATRGRYV